MKRIFFLLILMLPLVLVAQKQLIVDEHAQVRSVGSFHSVRVSDAIDLYLSQGETEAMAVSAAKEQYRDKIKTEVEDGVLRIWLEEKGTFRLHPNNMKLRVYLSFRQLRKLIASGASDVYVEGTIKLQELTLNMSGASDFKGAVEVNTLNVELQGASDALVTGRVAEVNISASGASDFKGYGLETDIATVNASGASDIYITVNKELSARASGSSGVYYQGKGVMKDVKASGSSNVGRRS